MGNFMKNCWTVLVFTYTGQQPLDILSRTHLCMFTLLLCTCSGHIYNSYRTHSTADVRVQGNHIYQECQICAGVDTPQMLRHEYISYLVVRDRQTKIIVKIEENSILSTDIKFNEKHSPQSSWFNPRPVHMRCVTKWHWDRFSFWVLQFSPVTIILPMPHTPSFITQSIQL